MGNAESNVQEDSQEYDYIQGDDYIQENFRGISSFGTFHENTGGDEFTLATTLPEFIQKHLDENLHWNSLSWNPGIPIEFIEETLYQEGYKWEWFNIGANPNITPEFVKEHLYEIENWRILSINSGIPIEFIDETLYQPGYNWVFETIVGNKNITPKFVQKHLGEIKNWNELSKNSGIPIEFIDETLYQEGYNWVWGGIEQNPNITPKFVQEHLDEIKNWDELSMNSEIPIEFIEETLYQEGYEWKWIHIVENNNITPKFVQKHLGEIEEWDWLSENPGIPIEFIEETLGQEGYEWDWEYIGKNPNITPEFVKKHRHKIKNWDELSMNSEIPIEFIDETLRGPRYKHIRDFLRKSGYKWEWNYISRNQNITPEFIQKHLNEISKWDWLSMNPAIPIEFIDETWSQPGYEWDIRGISSRRGKHNKKSMIKAARS